MDFSYLDRNMASVRTRMKKAADAAGREGEVLLIAAAKSGTAQELCYLHRNCDLTDIGENRVQQLLERYEVLSSEGFRIHFIGHLQTNKVKYIIDKVCLIHSLDSERLAAEINAQASRRGIVMDVLIEVNIGREENKSGVNPEDVPAFFDSLARFPALRCRGFMTMAPNCEEKEEYLKYFSEISQLAVDIWSKKRDNKESMILSMGMSGSFEQAIACGATAVRVGRTLFEK